MGICPFCRAPTMAGDSICYSCGRVITGAAGMDSRVKGEFMRGSTRRAKVGSAPRHVNAKPKRRRSKKRSRIHQLAMLGLIAFVFMSPDAREFVLAKWAEVQEYAMDATAPNQPYPLEAEYTIVRTIDFENTGATVAKLNEMIPIPSDVSSNELGPVSFQYTDGTSAQSSNIQEIVSMHLLIDGESIEIPPNGIPYKSKAQAELSPTSKGNLVWWPTPGPGSDCGHGHCVRVQYNLTPGNSASFDFKVVVKSTSHSWWYSTMVDGKVEGKSEGASLERSGTFTEISERGNGIRDMAFSGKTWYDRGSKGGWAVDAKEASAPTVVQRAQSIEASLPTKYKDNVYAYARATFDWLNLPVISPNVKYDSNAPAVARGAEECLSLGFGDCDEQSNAFMSIMRYKGVPSWYVFGALADSNYERWEGHAWAYVMIPLSEEWCNDQEIDVQTCYVEGSVDVVNHKWLVHTPTAYIDWVESTDYGRCESSSSHCPVEKYYSSTTATGDLERTRTFSTHGSPEISGGTWNNKWIGETIE